MNKKLLHKTQRIYLYILIVLFAVTAPLFYLFIQKFYLQEIDETLMLSKSEFLDKSIPKLTVKDIPVWNKFNSRIQIQQTKKLFKDTLFIQLYYNQLDQENEPFRELNSPIHIEGKPYTLSIKTSLLELDDLMTGVVLLFVVILIILFITILFINNLLSTRMWKPFYQTLQQIERYEIDKSKQPQFLDTEIEEFNRLNISLTKLIQKNKIIFDSQREFVENAAHELQTPLAIFQSKIDMLMQTDDFTEQQSEILSALNDSVSRLNRLNKNMLFLSKIENENYGEKQTINVNEIIERQLVFFTEQAQSKNISIKTDFSEPLFILTNPALAEIFISNLFLNAIRHNVKNGLVLIKINSHSVSFINTGIPQPLDKEKLFTRFSKLNPSAQGNGLGLAIVKKIADLNNWNIRYSFSENKHIFSVQY